jgi:hypothetical protein
LFKNFRLGSNEARRLQFRFETYNSFNHTQFTGIETGAKFDQANNQTNTVTATSLPLRGPAG